MSILDDARTALEAAQEHERKMRAISEAFAERLQAAMAAIDAAQAAVRRLDEMERRTSSEQT